MLYLMKSMKLIVVSPSNLSCHNLYGINEQIQVADLIAVCLRANDITDVIGC